MRRFYGIDILKMLAMVMVVALHIMDRGGVQSACSQDSHSLLFVVQSLFYTACACAVDCFVLATGFVMCRHTFKYSRIFKLWGEVVFYSLCMTGIAAMFFPELAIGWRDWLMAVMPISFDRYWFVSRYVALFFAIPFLNHLLLTLDRKGQDRLILTGFIVLSVFPCLSGHDIFAHHFGYSVLWFFYLYLVGGYVSCNELWRRLFRCKFILFLFSMSASLTMTVIYYRIQKVTGVDFISRTWDTYASPFILTEAVLLLVFFAKLDVRNANLKSVIAYVAPSIFSVYVLHSNNVFRRMIQWNGKFGCFSCLGVCGMVGAVLSTAVLIFIVCVAIDIIRRIVLKIIMNWWR